VSYADGFYSAACELMVCVGTGDRERALIEWKRIDKGLKEHGHEITDREFRLYCGVLAIEGDKIMRMK